MNTGDVKEELRRFFIYDLHISPLNIDDITVDYMRDGQIKDIHVTFIPNINRGEEND